MKKLVFLGLVLTFAGVSAQKNLIKNGDFEKDLSNWNGNSASINPYDKVSGKKSCFINQYTGANWKGIDQSFNIPKKTYAIAFSVWMKSDNIEAGKQPYNAGAFTVEFATGSGKNISYHNVGQLSGTNPWKEYKEVLVVPEDAKKVRIILALAEVNGAVYYDAIQVNAVSLEDYNALQMAQQPTKTPIAFSNGGFEEEVLGWNGAGVSTTETFKSGSRSLRLSSDKPEWMGEDQLFDVPEGTSKVKVSGWLKADTIAQGAETWNTGVFIAEATSDGSTKVMTDELIGAVKDTTDWQYFEKDIAIPDNAKKFRLMLALSNCTGTLYADDLQVEFK